MKKIIFILLAFLLVYSPVKADAVEELTYKWQAIQPETTKTSNDIIVDWEYLGITKENGKRTINFNLIYTIKENYEEETLVINPDIFEVIAWGQKEAETPDMMPGDTIKVNLSIVNKSKYNYLYDEKSFVIYPYTADELEEQLNFAKITDEKITFSGEQVNDIHKFYRMYNKALRALTKNPNGKGYLTADNETLDTLLKDKGYTGINDLAKYYRDYYIVELGYVNNENTSSYNLKDFKPNEIAEILNGNNNPVYTNGEYIKEDNIELIALHYDFLFNYAMGVSLDDEEINDTNQHEYAPGEYMRDDTKGEEKIQKNLGILESNTENKINTNMHLSGPLMGNAYADYRITGHAHLSYTAEQGKVIAKYIDTAGNVLADEVITAGMVNKEYQTTDKIIDNYNLVKVEGEEIGTYTKEDIIVTYIYSLADKNIPDTGVKTNNNLEIAAASSIIILIGALFLKKKFN